MFWVECGRRKDPRVDRRGTARSDEVMLMALTNRLRDLWSRCAGVRSRGPVLAFGPVSGSCVGKSRERGAGVARSDAGAAGKPTTGSTEVAVRRRH